MRLYFPLWFSLAFAAPVGAQPPPATPAPPATAEQPAASSDSSPSAPDPAPAPPPEAPPGYYVEGQTNVPPAPTGPPPPGVYEPQPPGYGPIFEPPPPPVARHLAPRTALWAGIRLGWFVPFGYVYARDVGNPAVLPRRIPWSDYASSGLMLEGDVGVRLGRHYNVFVLWERAQLGSGDAENDVFGGQDGGDSDFWAIGLRASSDADDVGLLTEIALGYRQARATWQNGTELQFTGGVLEGRIGFGADIRLNRMFSISPLLTLGVGSFSDVDRVFPSGASASEVGPGDAADSHAWLTLGIGGHVDLFGTK